MKNYYIEKGEKYLRNCVFSGWAHSYDVVKKKYVKPYPEVTGYIIKYYCDFAEQIPFNIIHAANKLVRIQDKKTGGFSSFSNYNILFSFDTSQILIGLAALYKRTRKTKYKNAAIKAGDFLLMMQIDNGAVAPTYDRRTSEIIIEKKLYDMWNGPWSGLMCKLTEGFRALYEITDDLKYLDAKRKVANFYVNSNYIECTHPMGYWLEGLVEGEKYDKVDEILEKYVIPRIRENGYISYREDLNYAYVSGIAQLGVILYKRGYVEEAKKIRSFVRLVQDKNETGGIYQYCDNNGNLDASVHSEINSWGTKYYCELERMME